MPVPASVESSEARHRRLRPTRRALGAPALLLVLAALSACAVLPSETAGPTLVIAPSEDAAVAAVPPVVLVTVVGDSLIATTAPEQAAELSVRGYGATVQGNPAKPLTDPWIQARLAESGDADIVVIATASNDNLQLAVRADAVGLAQATREYAQNLTSTLDRVAAPCTVLVDARERVSPFYRPETATTTNLTMREIALTAARPIVVVPWSARSAAHDRNDWFVDDELHFLDASQRREAGVHGYTDAIADGVDQCRSMLGA